MQKFVYAVIRLQVDVDDSKNINLNDALFEMEYNFKSNTEGLEVLDTDWMETKIEEDSVY